MKLRTNPWVVAVILGELFLSVLAVYSLIAWMAIGFLGNSASDGSQVLSKSGQVAYVDDESATSVIADPALSNTSFEDGINAAASAVTDVIFGTSNALGAPITSYLYSSYYNPYQYGPYTYGNAYLPVRSTYRYVPPRSYRPQFVFSPMNYRYAPTFYVAPAVSSVSRTYVPPSTVSQTTSPPSSPVYSVNPITTGSSQASSSSPPQWLPDRSQWPPSTSLQSVTATPGSQYWHLVKALYCDFNDSRNNCPNLPGGGAGTSTYVMLIDASGNRTDAPLLSPSGQVQKSSSDMCNCNYTFEDSGTPIQIGGAPSDSISGLILYSVQTKLTRYHVRYFLTFQRSVK